MAASAPVCDFGRPAVDARLPGVDGTSHSIFEQAGGKGLVVAFICNHCPYVNAVIARIVRDATELKAHGVGFVAISANDALAYPEDSFDNMTVFARRNALAFPYLYDEDQAIAKAYGAVCTPDFFGFNKDMKLQYRGRLDASRKEIGPADLRRDLYEAMVMVALFGKGPAEQQPSIGCAIKWKTPASQL
ncbi:thioredoxin family protein [Sinorhizobium americanum]|uniref:AhpC/TSA family protein n=1 Tax=Sinorhizobium americanum TaxID=194963 RepID=A0A4R2BTU6_9HYPH|nr:thioredoxin family protein [Sinorhizobium americanum]TCN29559.1 AhpC/TSA family protein [Sinorhizobium americanum]